jgi:hypothetical protein
VNYTDRATAASRRSWIRHVFTIKKAMPFPFSIFMGFV